MEKCRKQQRLNIAVSLLQGKSVEKPRDGYDPGGFYISRTKALVGSALDMADELIRQNEVYESEEEFDGEELEDSSSECVDCGNEKVLGDCGECNRESGSA